MAVVLLCVVWQGFMSSPFDINDTEYVYVKSGDTKEDVEQQLENLGGKKIRLYWTLANMARKYVPRTGRYAIQPGQSFLTTYLHLQRGQQTPVELVIPSVRTLPRLAGFLSRKLMMDSAEVANNFCDSTFAATYGYNTATLPALFIPNTYEIYWDTSLEKFMKRMVRENKQFWEHEDRLALAQVLGLTPEEVVTMASIVDEETSNNGEKPRVAGLYMNRLRKGIPLQADPTVKFAVGDATLRRIRGEHLKVNNPYNTYLHQGLPPGPIRIASVAGIEAVLHMERHNYLYMCAKEDFSGTHNFAASFSEHQQNARKYQRALNERGIH